MSDLRIGDDELRESIEANQMRLMKERGSDLTIFSPRASFMAHHIGDFEVSSTWAAICNELIFRVGRLFPEQFAGAAMLPQSPGVDPATCISELEKCVREYGFVGINLNPNPSGGWWTSPPLTDRHWYPIYEKMVEWDIPALVHVSTSCNVCFHTTGAHYLNADTTAVMQFIQGARNPRAARSRRRPAGSTGMPARRSRRSCCRPARSTPIATCSARATGFPYASERKYTPCDASAAQLFALRDHLGFDRNVIVQATCHGADNRALVDALERADRRARGIATVRRDISDAGFEALHAAGVRGVRFNFIKRLVDFTPKDELAEIAARIHPLGWHVVVYFESVDLPELQDFFTRLPTRVIVDHMGRPDVSQPVDGPEFTRFVAFMREHANVWTKVSCPERLSLAGPPALDGERAAYCDVVPFARRLVETFPDRVLWGTDWPHPNLKDHMPDDGLLVDFIPTSRPPPICSSSCWSTTRGGSTGPSRHHDIAERSFICSPP